MANYLNIFFLNRNHFKKSSSGKFPTKEKFVNIIHQIDVPVGYGFGSSAAVALSLAIALNDALECKLSKIKVAQIAHDV